MDFEPLSVEGPMLNWLDSNKLLGQNWTCLVCPVCSGSVRGDNPAARRKQKASQVRCVCKELSVASFQTYV